MKLSQHEKTNGKVLKGERTKRVILSKAVEYASLYGLESLTIGNLSRLLKISKSGVYSHFGSKEGLQMATIDLAREIFVERIIEPNEDAENGIIKLNALLNSWILFIEKEVFPGGSFFSGAAAELDDRPGRPKNLVADLTSGWISMLEREVRLAVRLGEIRADIDIQLLVFRLFGYVYQANWLFRLHGDKKAFKMGRNAVSDLLIQNATHEGAQALKSVSGK